MKKLIYISIAIVMLLALVGSILILICFYCFNQNASFHKKFELIKIGVAQTDVERLLGTPDRSVPPFESLHSFWGNENIPNEKQKKIKTTFTYEAMDPVHVIGIGMFPSRWQIGFDENGNAICKHQY